MTQIIIMGGWGWRPQSLESVSEATGRMLSAMPDEPAGPWIAPRKQGKGYVYDPLTDISDIAQLSARIQQITVDAAGGQPPKPGFDIKIYRGRDEKAHAVECLIRAGLEGPRGAGNHILVRLNFATDDQLLIGRAVKDHMAALVRAWGPDHLSAHTYDFRKAQGWDARAKQIPVGWDTYLRDSLFGDLTLLEGSAIALTRADDGVYLTLPGTPQDPSMETAQLVRKALGYE